MCIKTIHTCFFLGGVVDLRCEKFLGFETGFKILKLHIKFSSIDIMDPALSNSPQ